MKKILVILTMITFTVFPVLAQQETGQIFGTVKDANGAVVSGATVTIRATTTGFSRNTTTNSDGYYVFVNVQPGRYDISVTATGFEESKLNKELAVGGSVQADVSLAVQGQKSVVDVVAGDSVSEINTGEQSISGVVNNKQLSELPTISRNPYGFVVTLPNVSESDPSGRGVGVAVNGQRAASTSILINGGENVDTFRATPGQNIPLDSVQEYRVVQGTFTADYGRATGAVVNLVTKSGGNKFFGSAYLFNRNSSLSSAGFDANSRPVGRKDAREFFNRNQYGFAIGGPIIKNKLLFFNNSEWLKVRSYADARAWVPTQASINAANINTRNFFAGYNLTATPTGLTTTLAGTGTNSISFQQVLYRTPANTGAGLPVNSLLNVSRIDFNPTSKFNIFGVLGFEDSENFKGSISNSPYQGFSTGQTNKNYNLTIAATYSFTSNLIGVTRFTYNKLSNELPLSDQPAGPTLYLRSAGNAINGVPIAFPGYLPFSPGSAIPFGGPQRLSTISQEVTWIKGNNIFKGGFQYYKIKDDRTFGAFQNSVQILGANNAQAVDNFVNGVLLSFQGAINPNGRFPGQTITLPVSAPSFTRNNRYDEYSFYGMNSWRLFPGFNANVGIRYEFYGPQRNKDRSLDFNFYFGGGNNLFERIRNGRVQNAAASPIGELWQKDKNNWAPSVGFAYDIEGKGTSSLRAGYALRYERNFGNVTFNVIQNPSAYGVVSVTAADIGAPIPITRNNAGPLAGSSGTVTLPRVSLRHVREDIVNAYAHQWSVSYERLFGNDLVISGTYSGTTGKSLYTLENINRFGTGTRYLGSTVSCPGLSTINRLSCQYTNINTRANNGYSNYQSLTASVRSNNLFKTGLTLVSNYTYSSTKDNLSSTFSESGNNFNLGLLDPFNPSLDFGYSDFDVRHRWVTNFIYGSPFDKYLSGFAKTLLGGWQLSGILNIQSGTPFTVYDCSDAIATVCKRLVPTSPNTLTFKTGKPVARSAANSFNVLSLTGQNFVTIGDAENGPYPSNMTARNAFRGPGSWNLDIAFGKTFAFTERYKLNLRMDASNIFNHANLRVYGGETDLSAGFINAGKFGRRQIALGARFSF